jgi:hypothetical protein
VGELKMPERKAGAGYHPTEAKYKGGADEKYVTYDLEQRTRGGGTALYPKVKRVYIAGDVKDWAVGDFSKKSGRTAHGVRIEYERTRSGYRREGFTASRGQTSYAVRPATVGSTIQRFTQVIEVPERASNVRFQDGSLPARYRDALQAVR